MELLLELIIFIDSVLYNSIGLLFVVMGGLILIRMAGFPDLTIDGSFTIGAAVYAISVVSGLPVIISIILCLLSGALGGLLTWTVNEKLGVGKVVASVLSMIILVLVSPYVAGGSTQSLRLTETFLSDIRLLDAAVSNVILGDISYQMKVVFSAFWLIVFGIIGLILYLFFKSKTGLQIRYQGNTKSPNLISKNKRSFLLLGALMLGNSLVAFGGAIEAIRRGAYTNNMGVGIILVALAIMILGEAIQKSRKKREFLYLHEYAKSLIVGCLLYASGIQLILLLQIDYIDLRLLTAFFLLILLGIAGRSHSSSTQLF